MAAKRSMSIRPQTDLRYFAIEARARFVQTRARGERVYALKGESPSFSIR
jgi:hypothetical protein